LAVCGCYRCYGVHFYAALLLVIMNKTLQYLSILALVLVSSLSAEAQCAMCKAVSESSTAAGSTVATGLNGGIVYLMSFPYIIMGVVGYAIYRHRKQQTETKAD
jgi:hypothetical protein